VEHRQREDSIEDTSTGLKQNDAGLLCYVGGWITGVVFLIIEKKNRLVRFHAMQSLVTFGILFIIINIADQIRNFVSWAGRGMPLFPLELAAHTIFGILLIVTFILWIVMLIQTHHGRFIKIPLFGQLALLLFCKLDSLDQTEFEEHIKDTGRKETAEQPLEHEEGKLPVERSTYYKRSRKIGRIAAAVAAIVWNFLMLILFNFYSQYIACYYGKTIDGATIWEMYPLLTQDFVRVLPLINVLLILSIVGHTLTIAIDRYVFREVVHIVLHLFGMTAVIVFLRVFPLDFSVIPHAAIAAISPTVTIVVLIVIAVVLGIEALVRLIRLLINILR